jgi:hypothetical protein
MILKPQDIFITLKLVALGKKRWTYVQLANELHMSASEINAGVKRSMRARLLSQPVRRGENPAPIIMALEEFLTHGIKYAFPPDRGEITYGVPTGHAGPHSMGETWQAEEIPPVWPHPRGTVKGYAYSPLYSSVPEAAMDDALLHEMLALVDVLRDERSRDRNQAAKVLSQVFKKALASSTTE